jgi:hypothetical protein
VSYENVGQRIREMLLKLGYVRSDGAPDVQRFSWDFRFNPNHVHAWLRDEMTPFKALTKLCDALGCSEVWLLRGEERKKETPARSRPRNKTRVLWPALLLGAAALWPDSAQAHATPLQFVVDSLSRWIMSNRRRFRKDFRSFAGGMAFAL